MKIIETKYNGYNFRSRTEARWAVFFDTLGWEYEYEKEGYVLPINGAYLPDFYFPKIKMFAEIKGDLFTQKEKLKCYELASETKCNVLMLDGVPDSRVYNSTDSECTFVIMPKVSKYYPLFYTCDYDKQYFDETEKAINKSRSKRFEFYEPH